MEGSIARKIAGSRGPWHCPERSQTVWTANGDTQVAECKSRHLSVEGNRENARKIAVLPEALDFIRATACICIAPCDELPNGLQCNRCALLARAGEA